MKTITFYVMALLCLMATKLNAQTFERRVREISTSIEDISKEEKDSLKIEVEAVNMLLEKDEITKDEADKRKLELAEKRANNIETRVAVEKEKLDKLVQDKVDGNIDGGDGALYVYYNKGKDSDCKNDSIHSDDFRRTTSQFLFALGVNRMMVDGKMDNDNFKWRSDFYEWGIVFNSRLLKNNNLLHVKYGLSLQYNNLRPDDDKIFVTNGDKTILADSGLNIDVARLRYVNLAIPVHLEFDFTKKKVGDVHTYYPIYDSFKIGIGGYVGVNVKEKQILKYEDANGHEVKERLRGDYNVSDTTYGLSAYVGYGQVSLYAKYDLQPIFANNDVDQNNLSLGIRFDIN